MNFKQMSPVILTGLSIVSGVAAIFMSAYETPKAIEILDDHRLEIDPSGETDLLIQEKIVDYAKGYWRTGILAGVSIAASIASCAMSMHNYKVLAASTAAISAAYAKYKDKVKGFIGDEQAKLINKQVTDELRSEDYTKCNLYFEPTTGMTFKSSHQDMDLKYIRALHSIHCGSITLGEMYPELVKKDPHNKIFDMIWDQDVLYEGAGDDWLEMWFEHVNYDPIEEAHYYPDINEGKECYLIHYNYGPEPPECLYDRN